MRKPMVSKEKSMLVLGVGKSYMGEGPSVVKGEGEESESLGRSGKGPDLGWGERRLHGEREMRGWHLLCCVPNF